MRKRVEIRATGKVQAVGFRFAAQREALNLGLTGWVKNERDGSVSVVAEGKEEDLKRLAEWAKRGPTFAEVDQVRVEWKDYDGEFKDFRIEV
jgi:acylphosphatase